MTYLFTSLSNKTKCNKPYSSVCSLKIWHERLGHPNLKIATKALSSCNIPFTSIKSPHTLCHACQLGKSHSLPFQSPQLYILNHCSWLFLICGVLHLHPLTMDLNIMYIHGLLHTVHMDIFFEGKVLFIFLILTFQSTSRIATEFQTFGITNRPGPCVLLFF